MPCFTLLDQGHFETWISAYICKNELDPAVPGPVHSFTSNKAMSADQKAVCVNGSCSPTERKINVFNRYGNITNIVPDNEAGSSQVYAIEETVNLKKESERLKTFDSWPVKFLKSSKMASAGFYYLKRGDKVRCAFCGIEIGSWKPGDDPMNCHAKWAGHCLFVNKQPVGNIPLRTNEEDNHTLDSDTGYDTCGPYGIPMQNGDHQSLKEDPKILESPCFLKTRPPSFPEYAPPDARLRSYDSWPISLKLKPKILSEAGFFYTGKGDQTICFHCGGGLKDWEDSDEPWVEHARWFSKCPYVVSLKGKAFVDKVCGKKAEEDLKCTQLNGLTLSSSTGDLEKVQNFAPKNESSMVKEDVEGGSAPSDVSAQSSPKCSSDVLLCKICYAEEVGAVFFPCGHMMACMKCALSLTSCAICRQPVTGFFRAFFS